MRDEVTWIQTHSGRQFWPLEPRPGDFDIHDIAHSLSLLCRFNGHCRHFYSVAEHSLRMSLACSPANAMWGLLHDMAEAYFGDIPRPVKEQFPTIAEMEDRLLQVAAERFGLPWPIPEEVHRLDEILLATEARDLMGDPPDDWRLTGDPLPGKIIPMSPPEAEGRFLERFTELQAESEARIRRKGQR